MKWFFLILTLLPTWLPAAVKSPVQAELVAEVSQFVPGKPFLAALKLQHDDGWHTYWKDPGAAGLATSLKWDLPAGVKAGPIQWPEPIKVLDADGLVSNIHTGTTLLVVQISPSAGFKGSLFLQAQADWIMCREVCIPGHADLRLMLQPAEGTAAIPSAEAGLIAQVQASLGKPPRTEAPSAPHENFWLLLLWAFVGGLILNIMPCVLPVLSLKVLSFVKQSHEGRRRSSLLGASFSLGILVSFWALAAAVVAFKSAGMAVGWGFQFQDPAFVAVMAVVVTVFALNLLGVFEINAPSTGLQGVYQAAGSQGLGGAFVNGVIMTLLATPCTAPFLGSALGFAFSQSGPVLFLFFTSAALGLAAPYQLLSLFPRALAWMPKPGPWMIHFKHLMGFLMLGALVWLLDVLGSEAGPATVTGATAFLLVVSVGCWILGTFLPYGSSPVRKLLVWLLVLLLALGGYRFFLRNALREAAGMPAVVVEAGWVAYTPAALKEATDKGKTVFLDFTAQWCWTCKVNEKAVLGQQAVQARFKELGVVLMKADWTKMDPEVGSLLKSFGRSGVPLYVIYPGKAPGKPIVLPEIITSAIVLEGLEKAGGSKNSK